MIIVFFFMLFLTVYPYLIYPLLLYILFLFKRRDVDKADFFPMVSLVISAYNEENIIETKLKNSLALDYPKDKLEIIVASESDDRTNDIVEKHQGDGIKLFSFGDREGKAATLYKVVPEALGEIVVFSDANAMYEKNALRYLARCFNDKRIGCVSGQLKYMNPDNSKVGKSEGLYWKYEEFIKKLESRHFSLLGANGSIFALRKNLYFPMQKNRGDDFELAIMTAINGFGVVLEPKALSFERSSLEFGSEFKRKARMISWNFKSARLLLKKSLKKKKYFIAFQLLSHKILRWLTFVFLIGMLFSNFFLTQTIFQIVLYLQLIFYTLAFLGYLFERAKRKIPSFLYIPYYFCLINWASITGMFNSFFKKHEATWEKVRD